VSGLLRGLALASLALLSACASRPVHPPQPPPVAAPVQPVPVPEPPKPTTALEAGVALAPPAILNEADAAQALTAFRVSCGR
jgi:membrane-bound lytic murein transglycosylase A